MCGGGWQLRRRQCAGDSGDGETRGVAMVRARERGLQPAAGAGLVKRGKFCSHFSPMLPHGLVVSGLLPYSGDTQRSVVGMPAPNTRQLCREADTGPFVARPVPLRAPEQPGWDPGQWI